jgi:6-pyruvoyltetrahydropterin/6-carboxytetrahydropterin synthase
MMNHPAQRIRITKKFTFDMAHALYRHEGPCQNIHGHTYRLSVTLLGKVLIDDAHPGNGMVLDFSTLSSVVKKHVIEKYDHALALHRKAGEEIKGIGAHKVIYTDLQPTCENLLLYIRQILLNHLPPGAELCSLRLEETPTSYAEWHFSDNA